MRRFLLASLVLGGLAIAAGSAHSQTVSQQAGLVGKGVSADVVQQAQWGPPWHNRWRSHRRWGSPGPGPWHNRWRSHRRWGSVGPWHNRRRSHYRWGSGYRY